MEKGDLKNKMEFCSFYRLSLLGVILALSRWVTVIAEDANNNYYNNDDANNNNNNQQDDYVQEVEYDDDQYIKYWTEYAVLPKKCITYNNVDMIVFSVFPNGYKTMCTDDPMGTYMTTVPTFVGAYLDQLEANAQDQGIDDYETPESAQFVECYPYQTNENLVSLFDFVSRLFPQYFELHTFF